MLFLPKLFHVVWHEEIFNQVSDVEVPVVKWFSSLEVNMVTRFQTLDETLCISHSSNTFVKGMNPIIPSSSYGQIVE